MAKLYADPYAIKTIEIRMADDSIWEARMDRLTLKIELVKQIKPPPATKPVPTPSAAPEPTPVPPPMPKTSPKSTLIEMVEKVLSGMGKKSKQPTREDQPEEVDKIPDSVLQNMKDNSFRSRLSNIMLDNKYDRKLRGRTRGKLDMTRLYKVPTQARNVFTMKQSRRGKNYNVMLVVDESGSMDGSKARVAAEITVFLAKAFEGININIGIIGFNKFVTIRKEFETPADYERIYAAIKTQNFRNGYGDNCDYDAINRGLHMFDKAPAGKNIMLFLSDGQPEQKAVTYIDIKGKQEKFKHHISHLTNYEKQQEEHLHHLVNTFKDKVTTIGIGIYSGGWQIPNHFVVKNLTELKPAIINELKKHIKRG
jgi:hypothetical protein